MAAVLHKPSRTSISRSTAKGDVTQVEDFTPGPMSGMSTRPFSAGVHPNVVLYHASLMKQPNSLIFVDLASDDPAAAAEFYSKVFGWHHDPRYPGLWHRLVPDGKFLNKDGSPSEISHLNFGVFRADNARPYPDAEGAAPRALAPAGRRARIWIEVSDDDSVERILGTAEELGAVILWRRHYWPEFNGLNHAFRDPWGNDVVLWKDAGDPPAIPADFTREAAP